MIFTGYITHFGMFWWLVVFSDLHFLQIMQLSLMNYIYFHGVRVATLWRSPLSCRLVSVMFKSCVKCVLPNRLELSAVA